MSSLSILIFVTCVGVAGIVIGLLGWFEPTPSLTRVLARLDRCNIPTGSSSLAANGRSQLIVRAAVAMERRPRIMPSSTDLHLVDRCPEEHVIRLVLAAVAGLVIPIVALSALQAAGLLSLGFFIPVLFALFCAAVGPVVVHSAVAEAAQAVRTDLRYQVSAYLDVVTMLLAGNTGYEGALEQASQAGDGRLFVELRRRMRESGARGSSLTDALKLTGTQFGMDELEQVAATAALSAAEGAPVAKTLSAKCATLRNALATEQESEARLRTSRLTAPIVGMALIFMGLVIYPALSFS
jgi:tight adherence protein C